MSQSSHPLPVDPLEPHLTGELPVGSDSLSRSGQQNVVAGDESGELGHCVSPGVLATCHKNVIPEIQPASGIRVAETRGNCVKSEVSAKNVISSGFNSQDCCAERVILCPCCLGSGQHPHLLFRHCGVCGGTGRFIDG